MEAIELMKAFPKSAEVIKTYYLGVLLASLKEDGVDLPEEFKQQVAEAGVDDEKVAQVIHASPRMLFDVFDEHQIYIDVYPLNENNRIYFSYSIGFQENPIPVKQRLFDNRKLAEKMAIIDAFKQLEEIL